MIVNITASAARLFLEAAARRHINLAPDNRLNAFVARSLVEIDRSIKHAMVSERESRKLQLMRLLHQPVQTTGPIEQRILGVQMEMNKLSVRHGIILHVRLTIAQENEIESMVS